MTVDHVGASLYPELEILRIIGRIAFPIFCYLLVLGIANTSSVKNYILRLFIFGFISQVPYYLALGYMPFESLNIFFTLSFGVVMMIYPILLVPISIAALFIEFDFGLYGFIMIFCMRTLKEDTKYGIIFLLTLGIVSLIAYGNQVFFLLALPIILVYRSRYLKIKKIVDVTDVYPLWRKYFFYFYYPLHFIVIYFIKITFF